MDEQILQRLCVDERLGELDDDVRGLLHAYLEINPRAASATETSLDVLDRAAMALRPRSEVVLNLPPLRSTFGVAHSGAILKRTVAGLAIAASMVLAFWLGDQFAVRPESMPDFRAQVAARKTDEQSAGSFWSVRNLAASRSTNSDAATSVHWKSPLEKPEIRS